MQRSYGVTGHTIPKDFKDGAGLKLAKDCRQV